MMHTLEEYGKNFPGCSLTVVRTFEVGKSGHKVYRVNIHNESSGISEEHVLCECELDYETNDKGWLIHKRDSHKCKAQKTVFKLIQKDAKKRYGAHWSSLGHKEAIMDIFARVKTGEWLGQRYSKMIYAQEVAELLDIKGPAIWGYCDTLYAEERLELNGAILADYEKRFRFPIEIQQLLAMLVEEPLGWPNGDAGDGFLYTLEHAIHEHTDYKSGKNAFWEENFPHIAPHHLLTFGMLWIELALSRVATDDNAARDLWYFDKYTARLLGSLQKEMTAVLKTKRFQTIQQEMKMRFDALTKPSKDLSAKELKTLENGGLIDKK